MLLISLMLISMIITSIVLIIFDYCRKKCGATIRITAY